MCWFTTLIILTNFLYFFDSVNCYIECNDNDTFVEVNSTIFECHDNNLKMFGCRTSNGTILHDGGTIILVPYLLQCQKIDEYAAKLTKIGCFIDNKILGPSQTHINGSEFYECSWKSVLQDIVFQKAGCVTGDDGMKIRPNENVILGKHRFTCIENQQFEYKLVVSGCAHNNLGYNVGEMMIIGDFWFSCEYLDNGTVEAVPRGCIVDFGFLNLGEMFHRRGYLFRCESYIDSSTNQNLVRRAPVGCLELTPSKTVIEHYVGEKWVEGSKSALKTVFHCITNLIGQVAKVSIQCYFEKYNGNLSKALDAGCFSRSNDTLLKCGRTATGDLHPIIIYDAQTEDTINAIMSGFTYC